MFTITGNTKISELYHSEDELAHYGVKGMKWGVRKDRDYAQKKTAGDIKKQFDKTRGLYDREGRLAKQNDNLQKLHNSDNLRSARKKINELAAVTHDYKNNENLRRKYKLKALTSKYGKDEASRLSKDDLWLMYEDWDQGRDSSFGLYLKDRGWTADEYRNQCDKALKTYNVECKKVAESLLGKYGDMPVNRSWSWEEKNVKSLVADSLTELAQQENDLYYES